jgi:KaiC/GvpD/RAD55 family RecA-like ATPase
MSSEHSTPATGIADDLLRACETYSRTVQSLVAFSRVAWECAFDDDLNYRTTNTTRSPVRELLKKPFLDAMAKALAPYTQAPDDLTTLIINGLAERGLARWRPDERIDIELPILTPTRLVRELLGGLRPDHDLRFFVARAIRQHYDCVLSSATADCFHRLASSVNDLLVLGDRPQRSFDYRKFVTDLRDGLAESLGTTEDSSRAVAVFIEACRFVNYIRADYRQGRVSLRAKAFDADFLIARLFGLPTGIEGLDALFGGGIMLVEDTPSKDPSQIRGRSVLVLGRYATGKSLLALEMAVAVATKGGIAWVMPLEQTAEECLFALRSMCRLPVDGSLVIATDPVSAAACLSNPQPDRGVIIFLRTIKESFQHFVETFEDNVSLMQKYPIKLIIVDPLNALHREDPEHVNRSNVLRMFERAKRAGTNVWLIAEDGPEPDSPYIYEQNITDTVIHLSVKERHGDVQRYLEITKSRLQREQRGQHPYKIVAGQGLTVFPASAAVAERIASRRIEVDNRPVDFGFKPLDTLLGTDGIRAGDVIVLDGPSGTLKSQLALLFLLQAQPASRERWRSTARRDNTVRNFLFAVRDNQESAESFARQPYAKKQYDAFATQGELRITSLRNGFVHPGHILQHVEQELLNAQLDDREPRRLVIDDVAHWETSCPFVREDSTFSDTIVDLCRRNSVTSLFVCSRTENKTESSLQQAIVDNADCLIQFERIQFRGSDRMLLRVLKSRGMNHKREAFELELTPRGIELKPMSSLLRILEGGVVEPVEIRLFLHSETQLQKSYNASLLSTVKSVLSPSARMEKQHRVYMDDALALSSSSSLDELQILQLDEFQVPKLLSDGRSILRSFPIDDLPNGRMPDYLPRLANRQRGDRVTVLPFYENLSLLAYRRDSLADAEHARSWQGLAKACVRWEATHDPAALFFDFPGGNGENYNCLFLEILLSLARPRAGFPECALREWVTSKDALQAARLMRILCRRSHFQQPNTRFGGHAPRRSVHMSPKAIVWRTWYSTLNQLMSEMPANDRGHIHVTALPNRVSMAGEWFLAVPMHSAAPDVAMKLMGFITSREAELDRMKLGVGLPTRTSFYDSPRKSGRSRISPYFDIETALLSDLAHHAFARSLFDCYAQVSGVLSSHLQAVIELEDEAADDDGIALVLDSLDQEIRFMQTDRPCICSQRLEMRPDVAVGTAAARG